VAHSLRIAEICRRAREHALRIGHEQARRNFAIRGVLYGVDFALANQAFGTGRTGVIAAIDIAADGTVGVYSNCVDMGNGSATTLAISTASWLGTNAARVLMGDPGRFTVLDLSPGTDGE